MSSKEVHLICDTCKTDEEEIQRHLKQWKENLKINICSQKWRPFVLGKVTSLQMVIAAMKLKDTYPLEEKL